MFEKVNEYYKPSTDHGRYITQNQAIEETIDSQRPMPFRLWIKRTTGIIPGKETESYNRYLTEWHNGKRDEYMENPVMRLKADYIKFINYFTKYLTEEDKKYFIDDINWDNYMEVESIIPVIAKRLKEITIYFADKRNSIKNAKLRYNMVGSSQSVERLFYRYLLKAFTQRNNYIRLEDQEFYDMFPALSAVNDKLKIKIEEIYDDTEYFDKNPKESSYTAYPNLNTNEIAKTILSEAGYDDPEKVDWLYSAGFQDFCVDNPLFYTIDDYLLSGHGPMSAYTDISKDELTDYYKFELTKKYMSEDYNWVSGGYYENKTVNLNYNLEAGNNWIFFPSGEASYETPVIDMETIPLTSTSLIYNAGAIGSDNYVSADKFFIHYGDSVSGAWLRDVTSAWKPRSMSAVLPEHNATSFKFPYPGYGLVGEDIEWNGPSFDNYSKVYDTLTIDEQKRTLSAYWNEPTTGIFVHPKSLQDTTLVESGATPSKMYSTADKITVREPVTGAILQDENPNGVFTGKMKHAFLYDVQQTDIPITQDKNYINWPLQKYDNNHLNEVLTVPENECARTALSSTSPSAYFGSRAGYGLFDSDIIYKLNSRNGSPIECAFLSGRPFTNLSAVESLGNGMKNTTWTANATGCFQTSLNLKVNPKAFATFMWLDEETPMDDVVFSIEHSPDCNYRKQDRFSLYKENPADEKEDIDYEQWKKCNCGAIKYSPLGHPGKDFDDYHGYADACFVDTTYPVAFDKGVWTGRDGNSYKNSTDFGWYQLTGTDNLEPDIGWGKGRWVARGDATDNPTRFTLKPGLQYKYYRSNIGWDDDYIETGTLPYLVVRHRQSGAVLNVTQPVWMKAVADEDGTWHETEYVSDMTLGPNDTIVYDHINSNWYCVTGQGDYGPAVYKVTEPFASNGNPWVNFTSGPINATYSIKWPKDITAEAGSPSATRSEINYAVWKVDMPGKSYTKILPSTTTLQVIPEVEGACTISVTGLQPIIDSDNAGTTVTTTTADGKITITSNVTGADFYDSFNKIVYNNAVVISAYEDTTIKTTSGAYEIMTVSEPTINFALNVPLYGWDRENHTFDETASGARPFWADASEEFDNITKYKGVMAWGGGAHIEEDYVPVLQPQISDIVLSAYTPIMYEPQKSITWVENFESLEPEVSRQWCKLYVDTTQNPTMSSQIDEALKYTIDPEKNIRVYDVKDYIISASNEPSDIVLRGTINGQQTMINYWANQSFVWSQDIIDLSNGEPPSGGTWNPGASGELFTASVPYANLSNRHYPTVAIAPVIDNFYTRSDTGLYFTPVYLGAPVAICKWMYPEYNYMERYAGSSPEYYSNPEVYSKDYGFSDKVHNTVINVSYTDARWMKSSVANGVNAGNIINPSKYEQFMPYKTRFESRGENNIGIHRQSDDFDPWEGEEDKTWRDNESYPLHFTKQQPIHHWVKNNKIYDDVYEWSSDIFGFSYALIKPDLKNSETKYSVYEKQNSLVGNMVMRLQGGQIINLEEVLSSLRDYIVDVDGNGLVKDFSVVYDLLVIRAAKNLNDIDGDEQVILYKLVYDSDKVIFDKKYFSNLVDDPDNILCISGGHFTKPKKPTNVDKLYLIRFISEDGPRFAVDIVNLQKYNYKTIMFDKITSLVDDAAERGVSENNLVYDYPVGSYNEMSENLTVVMQVEFSGSSESQIGYIVTAKINPDREECDIKIVRPRSESEYINADKLGFYKIEYVPGFYQKTVNGINQYIPANGSVITKKENYDIPFIMDSRPATFNVDTTDIPNYEFMYWANTPYDTTQTVVYKPGEKYVNLPVIEEKYDKNDGKTYGVVRLYARWGIKNNG